MKWDLLDRAKPTLVTLLSSWTFDTFWIGFMSFNVENLECLHQRISKLLVIKYWEWFDPGQSWTRADWFEWGLDQAAEFFLRPPTLTSGNLKALWPTDPKSLALKDLNLLSIQNIKRLATILDCFALSIRPHFNSTYLQRVPFSYDIAVYVKILWVKMHKQYHILHCFQNSSISKKSAYFMPYRYQNLSK